MNKTVYRILQHTCKSTGITPTQALTIRKHNQLRYVAFYLLHDYCKMTTYQIAEQFWCSQGLVSQGIHKVLGKVFKDGEFRGKISVLVKKMAKF
jgi:chromosomal replication initiation ATPase DnaA